jgi:hypothetical protein
VYGVWDESSFLDDDSMWAESDVGVGDFVI